MKKSPHSPHNGEVSHMIMQTKGWLGGTMFQEKYKAIQDKEFGTSARF